jgi:hypothetical protein
LDQAIEATMKYIELLTVTPDDGIVALAMVTVMLIGMRLLYGAWPWESRKTWYRTKPFVPASTPPEPTSEATETPVDTKNDHFDRKLTPPEPNRKRTKRRLSKTEATETPVDTENDHFDRKLMAAE